MPQAFYLQGRAPLPIRQETGWDLRIVLIYWQREDFRLPLWKSNPDSQLILPVAYSLYHLSHSAYDIARYFSPALSYCSDAVFAFVQIQVTCSNWVGLRRRGKFFGFFGTLALCPYHMGLLP
jgi:hypothetical protein